MGKKSISHDKRVEIVTLFKQGDLSYREIGDRCQVSKDCVMTTVKNWQQNGSVDEKKRSGRPRKTTERQDRKLFSLARATPTASTKSLSSSWVDNGEKLGSSSTVSRRLREFGLESHVAVEKPKLTKVHKRTRASWCKARLNWGFQKWASVIFSDEANYMLVNRKTTPQVRRFRHEKYEDRFVKKVVKGGGGSIGVWGCIGQAGTGCCMTYPGRLNAERYKEVLENSLKPSIDLLVKPNDDWLYQQDNAPCHTAKSITKWLRENEIKKLPWPANSPDLNPIEHLWTTIDRKLAQNPPNTMAELEEALVNQWNTITQTEVLNLIESMPKRVELCYKANGGYFKY